MDFNDLLKIDRDEDILKYKFSNSDLSMYFTVRAFIFDSTIKNNFNQTSFSQNDNKIKLKKKFEYLFWGSVKNIFFSKRKPIYFFTSEVLFYQKDGQFLNKLYEGIFENFKKYINTVSTKTIKKIKTPKKQNVYYSDIIFEISKLVSTLKKLKKEDENSIRELIEKLESKSKINLTMNQFKFLENWLQELSKIRGVIHFIYNIFFKLKKPKLIIIEDAHYLGDKAFIIEAAKQNKIITAEFQHGYIGRTHYAYNYHIKIFSKIKEVLPDFFLTFGSFWGEKIRTPSKIVTIGHSEINNYFEKITLKKSDKKKILVISNSFETDELFDLCNSILNSVLKNKFELLIRPHPLERDFFKKQFESLINNGFNLDQNDNIYETLIDTEVIISLQNSTVLYESIFFTKRIFLKNSKISNFKEHNGNFIMFSDFKELEEHIIKGDKINLKLSDVWEKNYVKNFYSFLMDNNIIKKSY
tara:strand:- start:5772 stop:7181 length:1410 start_codon:yes stop_codon:yes gene_type:complete